MKILVTGGLGYIGSHTVVELLNEGHKVVILDNLSNCNISALDAIQKITNSLPIFYEEDIRNTSHIKEILKNHNIDVVIHFAGLKSITESVTDTLEYYDNNVIGTISLLSAMEQSGVKKIIFSSSASVYGIPKFTPLTEDHPLNPTNPYANTKKHIEEIISDLVKGNTSWKVIFLRYFNPVGANSSGLIGENPKGTPNNLMPYIARVAIGDSLVLPIYGNKYPTRDGTGIRDYIHVVDLASGHLAALNYFMNQSENPAIFNLGTGIGVSVFELIKAFEIANDVKINYKINSPRLGDVSECFADNTKACRELDWKPAHDLSDMCSSTWLFTKMSKR